MQKGFRIVQFLTTGYCHFGKSGYAANAKHFSPGALDVDLTGRHIVVTGATSGLGRATALALADRHATVHIVVRNTERGQALADELVARGGAAHVHRCDMSSLADIRAVATKLADGVDEAPVSVLVNNAGAMFDKVDTSADGFELGFATNTLGTFALTEWLLPVLERGAAKAGMRARVVTVSSGGMLTEKLVTEDLQGQSLRKGEKKIDGAAQYARCKRRQVALTEHWARRHKDIFWASMHPGWSNTPGLENAMPDFHKATKDRLRSQEEGADTSVYLAIADEVAAMENGLFFFDRKPANKHLKWAGTSYPDEKADALADNLRTIIRKAGFDMDD